MVDKSAEPYFLAGLWFGLKLLTLNNTPHCFLYIGRICPISFINAVILQFVLVDAKRFCRVEPCFLAPPVDFFRC